MKEVIQNCHSGFLPRAFHQAKIPESIREACMTNVRLSGYQVYSKIRY